MKSMPVKFNQSEEQLDERLSRPTPALELAIRELRSPLVILGAGGKMGPTLAVMAGRAAQQAGHPLEVIAVSRFSNERTRDWLESHGVKTLSCDLLERPAVQKLPDSSNVLFLVGLKFGTRANPGLTWAVNTLTPTHAAERYSSARMVALSTGNVYPLGRVADRGMKEDHPLTPLGEYANAAVARERLLEFHSEEQKTRMVLLRLSYAVELRYGVLVDIAQKVWAREPLDLSMGYFNCIWQGDANEMILRSFSLARKPPLALNLTGTAMLSVRQVARQFGELMKRPPHFAGEEAPNALLSDTSLLASCLGPPATPIEEVIRWVADWISQGKPVLDKPTHFQVRDGMY
jgi:nucleoside-diphosphate-sugar epimerase